MRRYVIIGAGAIGGTIGGRLAQHDVPVVWIARGEHAKALSADGMTLRTPDGTFQVKAPVWASPSEAELRTSDVLVLATKVHQATDALASWADVAVRSDDGEIIGRAGDLLPLITATNGVAAEDIAIRYFSRVYGAAVWCPATHVNPGEVIARYAAISGLFWLGAFPAPAEPDDLLRAVSADWQSARLEAPVVDDVMAWKRRKLVHNVANAVDALVQTDDPARKELLKSVVVEAETVLAASGASVISRERDKEERDRGPKLAKVEGAPDELGSSTFQSLSRATGTVETDYLNGEIVRQGHLYDVPTPVNAALASLARRAAASGLSPRSLSVRDVEAETVRAADGRHEFDAPAAN